jgi:predicted Fe-Mo cluster-binding NifX family protein
MKVAIVTNDGKTISQHFGRAAYYLVVEIQDNQVVSNTMRPRRTPHSTGQSNQAQSHAPGQPHGMGPEAASRHAGMAAQIQDCDYLFAGGMGTGAVRAMEASGIRVILTDYREIAPALSAWTAGTLVDRRERMD